MVTARRGRWLGRATVALLAILVLGGGLAVERVVDERPANRGFVTRGVAGEEVRLWPGTVQVNGARTAASLQGAMGGEVPSDGVWIAADVTLTGGDRPLSVGQWWLLDAEGRRFEASERSEAARLEEAQPGSPLRGEVVFEVPPDVVEGRQVEVWASVLGGTPRFSAVAAVSLELGNVETAPLIPERPRWEESR